MTEQKRKKNETEIIEDGDTTVIIKDGKRIEITAQVSDREVGRVMLRFMLSLGGSADVN